MKMKVPRAAIAAAASKVSTKLDAPPPASIGANKNTISKPQLSRRLQRRLADAKDQNNHAVAARLLADDPAVSATCDASFMKCILSPTCRSCFQTMQENDVDWTNVVPDTPCQDVLGFLVASGHCREVRDAGHDEEDAFCAAFDSCVVWDDDDAVAGAEKAAANAGDAGEGPNDDGGIDCAALTECAWEGMHEHFLGDGVCHDALPGCYNSEACAWDGGDCCEDTCHHATVGAGYGECGEEGYACRDPDSIDCQPALAREVCGVAAGEEDAKPPEESAAVPSCSPDESPYRLVQYDSWGDGWDNTQLTFFEHGFEANPVYEGGLEYGAQGTVYLCLTAKDAKCYHVKVENGVWGNEISWELRPLKAGAPVLAAGGSPSDCTVPLGGEVADCPKTCEGARPDTKIDDPNYQSYKAMEGCIEQKCLIQVGNCAMDESCSECMQEASPDYCYANDNFNVLIDCSMCSCTEERPAYCDAKSSDATAGSSATTHEGTLGPVGAGGEAAATTAACSPEQTIAGTSSLIKFSECADVDQMMAMVTDFDNDNFGMLDLFETCAHEYMDQPMHGGKSALDCMKILHGMIMEEDEASADGGTWAPKNAKGETLPENIGKAISDLTNMLYYDAEEFCDCASATNKDAPMCSSFTNFKTLLYEAVDACRSLDMIDCNAWEEFYTPCKKNLIQMFDTMDFSKKEQCTYVEEMCGGAGPFPAFRRLDCAGEIAKPAWDFHTMYERGCLGSSAESPSSSSYVPPTPSTPSSPSASSPKAPTPKAPTYSSPSSSSSTTGRKQYKPYDANGATDEKKPYHSSDPVDETDASDQSDKPKKKHHFFRNTIIFGVLATCGYVWHKKRRENFDYMRFRRLREARNYAGNLGPNGGTGEYTGVSMSDSSSFEPPTLPPMPSDNTSMI